MNETTASTMIPRAIPPDVIRAAESVLSTPPQWAEGNKNEKFLYTRRLNSLKRVVKMNGLNLDAVIPAVRLDRHSYNECQDCGTATIDLDACPVCEAQENTDE